jgi:ribosomal protein S26
MKGSNNNGALVSIPNCSIAIPGAKMIELKSLPDISDTKQAAYNDEAVIGRSFPLKTFSHSENRVINMTLHFYIIEPRDVDDRLSDLRAIESATYPREGQGGVPFIPPPVCQIQCGKLLGDRPLCAVLRNYSVKYPIDVVWIENGGTYLPIKFDVETSWEVIYRSDQLPGQSKIFDSGV